MSTMTISRNTFIFLCVCIGLLIIALLLGLFEILDKQVPAKNGKPPVETPIGGVLFDGKQIPVGKDLDRFLREGNYGTIMLINDKAQIKVGGVDGKEPTKCGTIEGTKLTGNCKTRVNITHKNTVTIYTVWHNPNCRWVDSNGTLVQVHRETGHDPCHGPVH